MVSDVGFAAFVTHAGVSAPDQSRESRNPTNVG